MLDILLWCAALWLCASIPCLIYAVIVADSKPAEDTPGSEAEADCYPNVFPIRNGLPGHVGNRVGQTGGNSAPSLYHNASPRHSGAGVSGVRDIRDPQGLPVSHRSSDPSA